MTLNAATKQNQVGNRARKRYVVLRKLCWKASRERRQTRGKTEECSSFSSSFPFSLLVHPCQNYLHHDFTSFPSLFSYFTLILYSPWSYFSSSSSSLIPLFLILPYHHSFKSLSFHFPFTTSLISPLFIFFTPPPLTLLFSKSHPLHLLSSTLLIPLSPCPPPFPPLPLLQWDPKD